jgi:hypothetical protein
LGEPLIVEAATLHVIFMRNARSIVYCLGRAVQLHGRRTDCRRNTSSEFDTGVCRRDSRPNALASEVAGRNWERQCSGLQRNLQRALEIVRFLYKSRDVSRSVLYAANRS